MNDSDNKFIRRNFKNNYAEYVYRAKRHLKINRELEIVNYKRLKNKIIFS